MCGICGISGDAGRDELTARVQRMLGAMRYRGPDQQGIQAFDGCVIGANRLSIIDLQKGDQPIHNEDASVWVVYNGEVYNFRDLRTVLAGQGHRFVTDTDTEVIVHLYEQEGIAGFEKLNGMFAFALYDDKQKKLMLVRDRIGIKPLYYSVADGIVFASEMKVILAQERGARRLNLQGVARYFAHDYTPAPDTVVDGICKLLPGMCLVYEQGHSSLTRYAAVPVPAPRRVVRERELEAHLDTLLNESVRDQLAADVPVGVFLSGGIDSSTVAYFASKVQPGIETFSMAFDEPTFDEDRYAVMVSRHLGLKHTSGMFTFDVFRGLFDRLTDIMDEPVADPSFLPTYYLSRLAADHVKVVLSGEGGDEMFAGYPTYQAHRFAALYASLPAFIRRYGIEPIIARLPVSSKNFSLDFVAKKFLGPALLPVYKRHLQWMAGFSDTELSLLFNEGIIDQTMALYEQADTLAATVPALSAPETATMLDLLMYLPDDLLVKVDRTTMAASIESRVPLIDQRIVEFSMSLPFGYKIRGLTQKYLLKCVMKGRLPGPIISRKKKGFGIPLTAWLQHKFKHEAESLLSADALRDSGLFNTDYVARLLREHVTNTHDHRKKLWPLLVFVKWLQAYKIKVP